MNIYEYLRDSVPADHCRQTRALDLVSAEIQRGFRPLKILDVGCGDGRTRAVFAKLAPGSDWLGIDIESSPEVDSRQSKDDRLITYDGVKFPFEPDQFDLVYSHQAFEHIRHPELVLAEIRRVMHPDGLFIGQVSQFAPYHSWSLWNFTVYGWKRMVEDAGLLLLEMRSAIDGFTLMERQYSGRRKEFDKFAYQESPRNEEIEAQARKEGKSIQVINYRKLIYAGNFSFIARRAP